MPEPPAHRRGVVVMVVIAAVWIVLAANRPTLTYHFAPFLAAVAWPAAIRRDQPQPVRVAGPAAGASFVAVSIVSVVLATVGWMDGPTFWDSRPAWPEAVLFAALGALVGFRVAARDTPGVLTKLING